MEISYKDLTQEIKDILSINGWIQGKYNSSDGYCLAGAIGALKLSPADHGNLYDYIATKCGGSITHWNDTPERTFDDVLTLLDEIIVGDEVGTV